MITFRLGRHHDLRRTTNPRCGIAYPRHYRKRLMERLRAYRPRWDRSGLI